MKKRRNGHSTRPQFQRSIPEKANYILRLIVLVFGCIIFRLWHLATVQHEQRLEWSRRPQVRQVLQRAERGTIRDRFNLPLAVNKIQYNAAVLYGPIMNIPRSAWVTDESGKRVKCFKRREHIEKLSKLLGHLLAMDPSRVEDLIYSRAALFHQVPYTIKADISESTYYRLKMLEKDWIGVHAERTSRRVYPRGKVASDVIGSMGAISRGEYESVVRERQELEAFLSDEEDVDMPDLQGREEAEKRLNELEERAYTLADFLGKTGIEGQFEEQLRGYYGRHFYYSDATGHFLRELPGGRDSVSGQRLLLTISAELQEYAEKLLIQNEKIREGASLGKDPNTGRREPIKQPWIKGGAIVAMDPNNGEVLALATHPRYDPNDFIPTGNREANRMRQRRLLRWLEHERYIGQIWNGEVPMVREKLSSLEKEPIEEESFLSFSSYLSHLFPKEHPIPTLLRRLTISEAVALLQRVDQLMVQSQLSDVTSLINTLYEASDHTSYQEVLSDNEKKEARFQLESAGPLYVEAKRDIDQHFQFLAKNHDKILVLDFCRLFVDPSCAPLSLLEETGQRPLSDEFEARQAAIRLEAALKSMMRHLYHTIDFQPWREHYGKSYLRLKRLEEKEKQSYQRPYLEHLDALEAKMFARFWKEQRGRLMTVLLKGARRHHIATSKSLAPYMEHLESWEQELGEGAHQALSWRETYFSLKGQLASFSSELTTEWLGTIRRYNELNRPLLGRYRRVRGKLGEQLEKDLASAFYPQNGWGYGRSHAFRQATTQGSVFKLVVGYEALIQRYRQLSEFERTPENLNPLVFYDEAFRDPVTHKWCVGRTLEGEPIPQIYKGGRLLKTLSRNVGKTDLAVAIERSSNPYFGLLAGDLIESPEDINRAASELSYGHRTGIDLPNEYAGKLPTDLLTNRSGLYSYSDGQHSLVATPLQAAVMLSAIANGGKVFVPKIVGLTAGKELDWDEAERVDREGYPYQNYLKRHAPPLPQAQKVTPVNQVHAVESQVRRHVPMPPEVRGLLLEGMHRVVKRIQKVSRWRLFDLYKESPEAVNALLDIGNELTGKTSTGEALETVGIDPYSSTQIYNHIWFGGISFLPPIPNEQGTSVLLRDDYGRPELVVVVYLPFGGGGSDTSPLAAQIATKWREINSSVSR